MYMFLQQKDSGINFFVGLTKACTVAANWDGDNSVTGNEFLLFKSSMVWGHYLYTVSGDFDSPAIITCISLMVSTVSLSGQS